MRRLMAAGMLGALAACAAPVTVDDVSKYADSALCLRYGEALRNEAARGGGQLPIVRDELGRRQITSLTLSQRICRRSGPLSIRER